MQGANVFADSGGSSCAILCIALVFFGAVLLVLALFFAAGHWLLQYVSKPTVIDLAATPKPAFAASASSTSVLHSLMGIVLIVVIVWMIYKLLVDEFGISTDGVFDGAGIGSTFSKCDRSWRLSVAAPLPFTASCTSCCVFSYAPCSFSWNPTNTPGRPLEVGECGLVNLGNSCYMNSTLQVCDPFRVRIVLYLPASCTFLA